MYPSILATATKFQFATRACLIRMAAHVRQPALAVLATLALLAALPAPGAWAQGSFSGSVDESFGLPSPGASGPVSALALQPDGKVLVGGQFTTMRGVKRN